MLIATKKRKRKNEMKKPLKILIIDNNREEKSKGSKNIVHWALKMAPEGSEVLVRRAPDRDLPQGVEIDALLLSGSRTSSLETEEPWIRPYDEFVTRHLEKGTPILGICYGHQTVGRCLARMNGQKPTLRTATDGEFGWIEVRITDESRLLEGLHERFITYESHFEEVAEVPPGAFKFAETDRCALQGFEVRGKPVFGIQFHPEYGIDEAEASLAEKLKNGVRKEWIVNAGKGSKLYDENVGKVIFGNFFGIASRS